MAGNAVNLAVGNYEVTWDGTIIGLHDGPIRLIHRPEGVAIRASKYGDTDIDGIHRGGNWFVQITIEEWKTSNLLMMFPHMPTFGTIGTIGKLDSAVAKELVLTADEGTTAASATKAATYTFPLSLVAFGVPVDILLDAEQRNIPLIFKCLPDNNSIWFTAT